MRMSPRKKDVYLSPGYGGQQTEQAETCPRSGFAHSPTSDFLPKNSEYKYKASPVSTGKSLSKALLFAEHGENMLCTKVVLNVRNNFCTQNALPRFELGIFMY